MKKKIALTLIVVFCLAFSACGKSEAAEALEDKINGLTEIDGAQIQEIREAYHALTEKITKTGEDLSEVSGVLQYLL